MNVQWKPYDWQMPGTEEIPPLKKNANFVGILILALVGASLVFPSLLLMALQAVGAADLSGGALYGMSPTGYSLFQTAAYLLYLAVPSIAVALLLRRDLRPFPSRRVAPSVFIPTVMAGAGLMVLANLVASIVMNILSSFGVPWPDMPDTMEPTLPSLLLSIFSTAVLPALVEEMVFRGYVLGALRPQGDGLAIVFSSLLFALLHGNLLQIPFTFILGLVLAYMTVQTGCIWTAVALHFITNLTSVLLSFVGLGLTAEQQGLLNGAAFASLAVVGVIGAAILWAGHRRGDTDPEAVLRPIGNGFSRLTAGRRAGQILTAPAMLLGVIALVLLTVLNTAVS